MIPSVLFPCVTDYVGAAMRQVPKKVASSISTRVSPVYHKIIDPVQAKVTKISNRATQITDTASKLRKGKIGQAVIANVKVGVASTVGAIAGSKVIGQVVGHAASAVGSQMAPLVATGAAVAATGGAAYAISKAGPHKKWAVLATAMTVGVAAGAAYMAGPEMIQQVGAQVGMYAGSVAGQFIGSIVGGYAAERAAGSEEAFFNEERLQASYPVKVGLALTASKVAAAVIPIPIVSAVVATVAGTVAYQIPSMKIDTSTFVKLPLKERISLQNLVGNLIGTTEVDIRKFVTDLLSSEGLKSELVVKVLNNHIPENLLVNNVNQYLELMVNHPEVKEALTKYQNALNGDDTLLQQEKEHEFYLTIDRRLHEVCPSLTVLSPVFNRLLKGKVDVLHTQLCDSLKNFEVDLFGLPLTTGKHERILQNVLRAHLQPFLTFFLLNLKEGKHNLTLEENEKFYLNLNDLLHAYATNISDSTVVEYVADVAHGAIASTVTTIFADHKALGTKSIANSVDAQVLVRRKEGTLNRKTARTGGGFFGSFLRKVFGAILNRMQMKLYRPFSATWVNRPKTHGPQKEWLELGDLSGG